MTMRNPVYTPVFPAAVDPPLPPTKVADPILFARFDAQIRALEQAFLTGKSLYGGAYAAVGSFQTLSTAPSPLSLAAAYAPAASTAFVSSNAIQVLRKQDVRVTAAVSYTASTTVNGTLAIYQNGVLLPDSARSFILNGSNAFSVLADTLVAAQNGDQFAIYVSVASSTATLTYEASLIVTAAGAGQGLQGVAGFGVPSFILDKSFSDSPVTVPIGDSDVSIDTSGGDVELDIANGANDREEKTFRIRAGTHDLLIKSLTGANILVQGNPSAIQTWRVTGTANVVTLTWIAAASQWQSA